MRYLYRYFRRYRKTSIPAPLFKMFEVIFELLIPLVIADIIDNGILEKDKSYIVHRALLMAGMAVMGFIFAALAQYFAAYASAGIASDMRKDAFDKIQSLSIGDYEKLGASRLITVSTSDINQIQSGINLTLRLLLRSPIVVIGAVIMAYTIDVYAGLIITATIIVLAVFIAANLSRALPAYGDTRRGLDELVSAADNGISGVRVIRGFNRSGDDYTAYKAKSNKLYKLQMAAAGVSAYLNPVTFMIINSAVCVLIYEGYIRVDGGYISAGAVVALYNYMAQILVEMIKFANMTVNLSRAIACADRFGNIMSLEPESRNADDSLRDPHSPHSVEFVNVSFTYDGSNEPSLQDISFKCPAGGTIGIIGRTGSGKSTIAKLLTGSYAPDSGKILIDGIDITGLSKADLTSGVGLVLQKTGLFSGTLRENICIYRKGITEEAIDRAIDASCSSDIISGKPEGKDYMISPGGVGLSGGQKQRIGIARALAGSPGILILDDSTSALDAGTENRLLHNIRSLGTSPTRIIISQKIRTVRDADVILMVEDGKITYAASHDELLKCSESYRFLYELQKEADNVR